MMRFLRMMMLLAVSAMFLTACSDGGGTAQTAVVTDSTGKVQTAMPITGITGLTATIPKDLVLLDSGGNPVKGALTVDTKYSTSATGTGTISGQTLSAYVSLTIKDPILGTEVKQFGAGSPAFTATLDVPGANVGDVLNLYTSNDGQTWTADTITPTVTIATAGKATITITHLSYWGLFKASSSVALQTVSGTVDLSTAGAAKSAAGSGATVSIISYGVSGNVIDQTSLTSGAAGEFSAALKQSTSGGYVTVEVSKEGFTGYQKRLDITTPADLDMSAKLESVNVAISKVVTGASVGFSTYTGAKKSATDSFSFALVRYANGTKKAVAGSSAIKAAKAAGGVTELGIDIPASTLPGVSSLKGELNSYDPAKNSDRFPGSYKADDPNGKGEGRMVSLAFDYIKITDNDTGKKLSTVAKQLVKAGVTKAAAKSTVVTRFIPTSSCDNLFLEDYDTATAGQQVPVWSLQPSTGKWVFIGVGTVVDSAGAVISATSATACKNGGYYLKITVANTDFERDWWNLDHIVFDTPKKVCLKGKLTFTNSTSASGVPLNMFGKNIDYTFGKSGSDGSYTLETVLLNKNDTNRDATLNLSAFGTYLQKAVTLGDSPSCGTFDYNGFEKACEVSGKVVDSSGAGAQFKGVRLSGSGFQGGAMTDSAGAFTSRVKCGADISVYLGMADQSASQFNVSGSIADYSSYEKSDNGKLVVLNDITQKNLPPNGNGFLNPRSVKVSGTPAVGKTTANIHAFDAEGDYPIAYEISSGAISKTGNITATETFPVAVTIDQLAAGTYTFNLKLTDSKGNSKNIPLGNLDVVSGGNRPPIVNAFADKPYVIAGAALTEAQRTVTFFGNAYDPDGDNISYDWTVNGASVAKSTAAVAGALQTNYKYVIPSTAKEGDIFEVVFVVKDDGAPTPGTGQATFKITYGSSGDVTVTVQ